jgi:hypothetical protein
MAWLDFALRVSRTIDSKSFYFNALSFLTAGLRQRQFHLWRKAYPDKNPLSACRSRIVCVDRPENHLRKNTAG